MKVFHSIDAFEKEYFPNYHMNRVLSDAIKGKPGAIEKFVDLLFERALGKETKIR